MIFSDVATWKNICANFSATFTEGGHCVSAGNVGACLFGDGTVRWSYAPATPAVARKQCAEVPGSTFFAKGEAVVRPKTSVLSCDNQPVLGTCVESTTSESAEANERKRCQILGGKISDKPCPTNQLVGVCDSIIPGRREYYYRPTFTATSAKEECAGDFKPFAGAGP